MRSSHRLLCMLAITCFVPTVFGQAISVGTDSSTSASYGGATQTAGPFPWSDLGVNATASVTPGDLSLTTGGATSFALGTTLTPGEKLNSSSVFTVGYSAAWTGSVSAAPATGNVNSNFVYNIGPISGSSNILNVNATGGMPSADLSAALNAGNGTAVNASATASGPSAGVTYTLAAQACFIECVTVASASIGVSIGTEIQHSLSVTPTVTYGNLVWLSTTATYSASDPQAFIPGAGGKVSDTLGNPGLLGLSNGQRYYYNILPEVMLSAPVSAQAQLNLPASITASYEILGVGGSQNFPLGNLYSLGTGPESFDLSATFHNNDYYSIPLDYSACGNLVIACFSTSTVASTYTGQLGKLGSGDVPVSGSCGDIVIGCDLAIPSGSGTIGGYGTSNLGPLFPGDPSNSDICGTPGTTYAGQCINKVVLTQTTVSAPEIDSASMASGLTLLVGSLVVLRGRRRPGLGVVAK